jgi:solute carrier family 25 2-oxodicarboxylate transporter 21
VRPSLSYVLVLLLTCVNRLQDKTSTFAGPIDVVKQVIKKEGPLGLYAGMEATFWRLMDSQSNIPDY